MISHKMAPYSTQMEKQNISAHNDTTKENVAIEWYPSIIGTYRSPLKWGNLITISILHLLFVVSIFTYNLLHYMPLSMYIYVIMILNTIGVTAGAHRLWTHRSYKAKLPLRIFLMLCFTLAGQNDLFQWVRDHRVHHKYTETDADPHNSKRGFFFAHVGWLMMYKHPEVLRRGNEMDMSDIDADPVVQFHVKYFIPLKFMFAFIIPSVIPPILWGEGWLVSFLGLSVVRYVITINGTWAVNSLAHIWGRKPYDTKIAPSQNLAVSIIACGEGWHNYHHTFPWDYNTSEYGKFDVNFTSFFLDWCAKFGLAYGLRKATPEMVRRAVAKAGDGSHEKWGATNWSEYEE